MDEPHRIPFVVAFDYLCPFARNASESVVAGLRAGRPWDVTFVPFSLTQAHVDPGMPAVWDHPHPYHEPGILALCWGIAIRDGFPDAFPDAHLALFAARHDHGRRIDDEAVLREAVTSVGVDADAVAADVASGDPLRTLAKEHAEAVDRWGVWGVPTFARTDLDPMAATFVRLMERGRPSDVDRVLELLDDTWLNEFKRTRIPR